MNQVTRLKESTLRRLIVRAINEVITPKQDTPQRKWAKAVYENGQDPIHCKEFGEFFYSLIENPICELAVKMGFADESKSQSSSSEFIPFNEGDKIPRNSIYYVLSKNEYGKKSYEKRVNKSDTPIIVNNGGNYYFKETNQSNTPPLKIDKLFAVRPKIATDVITDFLTGVNYTVKDESIKDSFLGDVRDNGNIIPFYFQLARIILFNKSDEYLAALSRRIRVYAAHYCRKHYNEFVTQWAVGSKTIGGDLEDDEGNKIEAFDWQGEGDNKNKIDVAAELSKDPYTGINKETSVTDIDKEDTQSDDSEYYRNLIRQVKKILKDPVIQLRPQEKAVLNALIKVSSTRYSQDRVNAMADMSDTQKTQQIYKQIADMLPDIAPDRIPRLISLAINKAKKSEYAKIDERKQKMVKLIVNEVIKRILNESK